jgi:chromosome segregation ATPase
MTTEQRLNDIDHRLERLTTISEQIVNRIQGIDARTEAIFLALDQLRQRQEASQSQIEKLGEEQHNLTGLVGALIQGIDRTATEAAADRAVMQQMQSEVRGLQTENHRILEYLQEQRRGDAGTGN